MAAGDNFWPIAFFAGSIVTATLFNLLPNLRFDQPEVDEPVIVIDFMQWREPKPLVKTKKPVIPAKPITKPKPRPKPHQLIEPPPAVTETPPKVPAKNPAIDPEPLSEPDRIPKPVEPQVVPQPVKEPVDSEPEHRSVADELPAPVPLFKLTSLPRFVHKVEPEYPGAMRALGKEATVKLEVLVDRRGRVRKVTILKSGGEAFDEAATKALMSSSFVPGNVEGTPVAVRMRIPIRFSLR
ncbi:MAG: TonB family protein [Gammaproteobacteria bacterium]|jgi:protein TonB